MASENCLSPLNPSAHVHSPREAPWKPGWAGPRVWVKGCDSCSTCRMEEWNSSCVTLNYSLILMRAQRNCFRLRKGLGRQYYISFVLPPIISLHTWCGNRTGRDGHPKGSTCPGTETYGSWNLPSRQDLGAEPAFDPTAMCPVQDAAKSQLDLLANPPLFFFIFTVHGRKPSTGASKLRTKR